MAAHNFIRSITLYRWRNKPINLRFRIVIVQAFSPELSVGCTLCFFLTGCQMFHKSFCQAMLLCCAFCSFLQLKVLSEIVAILKFSFLGFIAFQSINIICLVLSFTSYPINDWATNLETYLWVCVSQSKRVTCAALNFLFLFTQWDNNLCGSLLISQCHLFFFQ